MPTRSLFCSRLKDLRSFQGASLVGAYLTADAASVCVLNPPCRLPPLYGARAEGAVRCPGDEVTSSADAGIHSGRGTGHGLPKTAEAIS